MKRYFGCWIYWYLGFPSSLSHALIGEVVSTAIMGVGAAECVNKVRWNVAYEIATAWLLTIPATALVAAGIYWLLNKFFA